MYRTVLSEVSRESEKRSTNKTNALRTVQDLVRGGSEEVDVEIVAATDRVVNRRTASRKEGGRKKQATGTGLYLVGCGESVHNHVTAAEQHARNNNPHSACTVLHERGEERVARLRA